MKREEPAGYDASFLGIDVELPQPVGEGPRIELPYLRFSVVLDTRRRLAASTGVNIDGGALQDLPRTGDWDLDPRVPASEQAGAALYTANDFDRGHLVRRRDPGWGSSTEARAATEATFVYTNAAPQAAVFNQSKDLWVGLEDHVLQYADSTDQRVSVFTAPVLDDDDPLYRGVRIPRRFWKIAVWAETAADGGSTLAAAGFVLDQTALIDLNDTASAVRRLESFRTFQVTISSVADLAGIDLSGLTEADVLPESETLTGRWSELERSSQIRLR